MKIVYTLTFEPVVQSRSILGLGCRVQPIVIVNDLYLSIGIVCLSVIRGVCTMSRISGRSALIIFVTMREITHLTVCVYVTGQTNTPTVTRPMFYAYCYGHSRQK